MVTNPINDVFCVHTSRHCHFVMHTRSCHARSGLLLVIFASQCPCVPPLFMTPKMDNAHFWFHIISVMQIRSCHARSGLLLVIIASQCPCVPPLFMTPKGGIPPFCIYIHSVMQFSHDHSMLHKFMAPIVTNPGAREFIKTAGR